MGVWGCKASPILGLMPCRTPVPLSNWQSLPSACRQGCPGFDIPHLGMARNERVSFGTCPKESETQLRRGRHGRESRAEACLLALTGNRVFWWGPQDSLHRESTRYRKERGGVLFNKLVWLFEGVLLSWSWLCIFWWTERAKLPGQKKGALVEKLFFMEFYINISILLAPLRVLRTAPRWAVDPTNTRQGRQAGTKQHSTGTPKAAPTSCPQSCSAALACHALISSAAQKMQL